MSKKNETLVNRDFKYSLEYDYNHNTDNCECEDYCRCGTIDNFRITRIKVSDIVDSICDLKKDSVIDIYCIDRILTANRVWDIDSWEPSICGGYYGEELESVVLSSTIATKCQAEIDTIRSMTTDDEKIKFILKLEYGYVLSSLEDKFTWEIKYVKKEELRFGQKDHYQKLDKEVVEQYKTYNLPRGICLKDGNFYKIVDGYHRSAAAEGEISIILGTNYVN